SFSRNQASDTGGGDLSPFGGVDSASHSALITYGHIFHRIGSSKRWHSFCTFTQTTSRVRGEEFGGALLRRTGCPSRHVQLTGRLRSPLRRRVDLFLRCGSGVGWPLPVNPLGQAGCLPGYPGREPVPGLSTRCIGPCWGELRSCRCLRDRTCPPVVKRKRG